LEFQQMTTTTPPQGSAAEHRRRVCLPHGYTATFSFSPATGLACDWEPSPPRIRTTRAQRRFLSAYTAERDAFITEVATMIGGVALVADVAGDGIVGTRTIKPETRK
jgi:hypothetical protein